MDVRFGDVVSRRCAILMPAYNEEEALPAVIDEWSAVAEEIDGTLVVINDGSKDGTLKVLREAQTTHARLTVIDKPNSGHGPSCLAGYLWAGREGFEWVFQTDSDGQTRGEEFLSAWNHRDGKEFIFGYRPGRGDGIARVVISGVLRTAIAGIFGTWVRDANVPFRLMRVEKLARVAATIPEDLFLANAYLTVLLEKSEHPVHWMKITFKPRQGGVPSVSMKRFARVGLKVVKDFWGLRRR